VWCEVPGTEKRFSSEDVALISARNIAREYNCDYATKLTGKVPKVIEDLELLAQLTLRDEREQAKLR